MMHILQTHVLKYYNIYSQITRIPPCLYLSVILSAVILMSSSLFTFCGLSTLDVISYRYNFAFPAARDIQQTTIVQCVSYTGYYIGLCPNIRRLSIYTRTIMQTFVRNTTSSGPASRNLAAGVVSISCSSSSCSDSVLHALISSVLITS